MGFIVFILSTNTLRIYLHIPYLSLESGVSHNIYVPNMDFWTSLAGYLTICGMLWAGFVYTEGLLKPETLTSISAWLRRKDTLAIVKSWPTAFIEAFDKLFGVKLYFQQLRMPSFLRSTLASTIFICALTFLFYYQVVEGDLRIINSNIDKLKSDYPDREDFLEAFRLIYKIQIYGWIIGGIVYNFAIDYLSLIGTRAILNRMTQVRGIGFYILWLLFDLIAKTCLAFGGFLLTFKTRNYFLEEQFGKTIFSILGSPEQTVQGFLGILRSISFSGFSLYGVFIFSTFLTSLWVWIFLLVGLLVRISYQIGSVKVFLDTHFQLKKSR